MTQIVRDHAQIIAPKIYGYYDNIPNPINAEVVLLELVRIISPVLQCSRKTTNLSFDSFRVSAWMTFGWGLSRGRS
jgi:hypothetical protein